MPVNGFSPIMLFGREYSSGHELEAPRHAFACARPTSGSRDRGGGGAPPEGERAKRSADPSQRSA